MDTCGDPFLMTGNGGGHELLMPQRSPTDGRDWHVIRAIVCSTECYVTLVAFSLSFVWLYNVNH